MWLAYQAALGAVLLFAGPFLLLRKGRHYLSTLSERMGRYRQAPLRGAVWIHAVSVGEVGVGATLATELAGDGLPGPLLVTTITPTGRERALQLLGDRATVAALPFDLGFPVRRFLDRFDPRCLVLVEGDYWPLLLHRVDERGIPAAVVNGRMGDASARRLGRWPRLTRWIFGGVERFGVQTEADARRLAAAGVEPDRITVTGNLKYEAPDPRPLPELEERLGSVAAGRPRLVAGSTMEGEEEAVLDAFEAVAGDPGALLVLAPRHPERWEAVARLLAGRGIPWIRRSEIEAAETGPVDVVLLDSLGELASLYRGAAAAFVGGTLVPTGGHNPLEAARWGVPIAVGPSMENFREMARRFDELDAWTRVANADELATTWARWLADRPTAEAIGLRGRRLVDDNRGALAATVALVQPLVGQKSAFDAPARGGAPEA